MVVGFGVALFTNRTLFANSFEDVFSSSISQRNISQSQSPSNMNIISTWVLNQQKLQKIDKILAISTAFVDKNITAWDVQANNLKQKLNTYNLWFNTLPPTNRLIIPKAWQNIPLVIPDFNKPVNQIKQKDFDKALYDWVVKYPTTATPWKKWNTLIFGHTSYESWKDNHYATVFQSLWKIDKWDTIQIVREWKLLTYKIIEKKIISPKKLNKEYLKYSKTKKSYLTLVGCYPFGSDKDRIVIVSELVN